MMTKRWVMVLASTGFLALAGCKSLAHGEQDSQILGVQDGNNGSFGGATNNIWFLGDEAVTYCIERSSDFPLTDQKLASLVDEVIKNWQEFMRKYSFDKAQVPLIPIPPDKRPMSLKFERVATCNKPTEQITFLFGKENAYVEENRLQAESAIGAAFRYPYNIKTYRTGGVVWVRNFSKDVPRIKHLLLHEFGHVLGMKHDTVHVMDRYIASLLLEGANFFPEALIQKSLGMIESDNNVFAIAPQKTQILLTSNWWCENRNGWNWNHTLPKAIKDEGGFNDNDCHRLSLSLLNMPAMQSANMELTFEGKNGKKLKYPFDISAEIPEFVPDFAASPGVYAPFISGNTTSVRRLQLQFPGNYYDFMPTLTGTVKIGGKSYGAVLQKNRGYVLRLFDHEQKRWYVARDMINEKIPVEIK